MNSGVLKSQKVVRKAKKSGYRINFLERLTLKISSIFSPNFFVDKISLKCLPKFLALKLIVSIYMGTKHHENGNSLFSALSKIKMNLGDPWGDNANIN